MSIRTGSTGAIARLSLEQKLPIIMGSLLLLGIGAIAAASHVEMRRSAMASTGERMSSVAIQLRDAFQQQTTQMHARIRASAASPFLAEYVRTREPRSRDRALDALSFSGPGADQVIGSELRDRDGGVLLSNVPDGFAFDTVPLGDALRAAAQDSAAVGRFHAIQSLRDTLVFPVVAPVANGAGFLVRWRRLTGSRRQRELITRLIGSRASLFLGNADGSVGTDLERTTTHAAAPVDTPGAARIFERDPDRARFLSASAPVGGTAWMVMVDVPTAAIEAPVARSLRRILIIAAMVLLVGLAAAWFMSRRITGPLVQLTSAAGAIAAGDFSRRARIDRSDELGRLGHAFDTMATEVRLTRENLEQRIEERTRDLNAALAQLHEAQDALIRRERLALLGQLSSGVGHELRNPLGVMTNAVYFLKAVLPSAPPSVHEYLEILQQQIALSEKIVGDLLDFARQKPPRRSPTPLREATDAQVHKLGRTDGVRVDVQVPDDLPPVLVDPVQLGQVILNLLTNAAQAMEGNGQITVRATDNGSRVYYEVADTGSGIPAANLEKIFEPLFTTKARGIGLGLAVSRMLARANGGDLVAASVPGEGATFTLTLEKAPVTA